MSIAMPARRDRQVFDRKTDTLFWVTIAPPYEVDPEVSCAEEETDWENDPFINLEPMSHDGPPDLAMNLEHYLYGAPKQ